MATSRQLSHSPTHQFTSLILFDGVCNLCNGFVQFVIARDAGGRFGFGALQSAPARQALALHGVPTPLPDTMVLVEDRQVFTRSTAALRIARRLPFPWSLAYAFIVVPRPLRDWVYQFVARYRYRWFGRRDSCLMPTPEIRARFLD